MAIRHANKTAAEWLALAEAGSGGGDAATVAQAMKEVGWCYDRGVGGVAEDNAQALAWYRRAAEHGNAEGMYRLGACLQFGYGAAVDKRQAAQWYQRAAAKGERDAMINLAAMNESGDGMAKDLNAALRLYERAHAARTDCAVHIDRVRRALGGAAPGPSRATSHRQSASAPPKRKSANAAHAAHAAPAAPNGPPRAPSALTAFTQAFLRWVSPAAPPPRPSAAASPPAVRQLGDAPVDAWTVDDVCTWAATVGLRHLQPVFRAQRINGHVLCKLTPEEYVSAGITAFGDRVLLEEAIAQLGLRGPPPPLGATLTAATNDAAGPARPPPPPYQQESPFRFDDEKEHVHKS